MVSFRTRVREEDEGMNVLVKKNRAAVARLTVFAPNDKAIRDADLNNLNLSSMFKKHVVPQRLRLLWEEVAELVNGGKLEIIDVDELISSDLLAEPNLFQNACLVVHGIKSVIPSPKKQLHEMDLFEDATATAGASNPLTGN